MKKHSSHTEAAAGKPPAVDLRASAITPTPRGRAVLCVWAALPGLVIAPFVFWQGLGWGLLFALLWCGFVFAIWAQACSFVASLGPRALVVELGIVFPVRRSVPRQSVTSSFRFSTPLLRLADACVLVLYTPGMSVMLPAIPCDAASALAAALLEHGPDGSAQSEAAP